MATKSQALKLAKKFGFEVDESVTGRFGETYMATLDHPTNTIAGDCRSIHVEDYSASCLWDEIIDRLKTEGPLANEPCMDLDCEYHHVPD